MNKKSKLAVFDIDGTIFRSSLLLQLTEALIKEKIFSHYARSYYIDSLESWQKRKGNYDGFIMDVVRSYLKYIKGVKRSDVWRIAERVVKEQKEYTYRYTRDLVDKLKKDHFMLAISRSPYEAVAPFAKNLGFDKTYALIYGVDDKVRFTGEVLYEDIILDKEKVLKRAIEKEGLNLKNSTGIGDTESDIPFLKMVTKPIAFNPSTALYKTAKRNKWKIVVERKDVIYEL
ncbi:MAG: HAD-IB family phosphatase [Parcubacteria group bacterium]